MYRILPHAEDRVDVRGHVQRVRCLRCDLVVAPGGLDAHRRQRREIIAVDQVVGMPGWFGFFFASSLRIAAALSCLVNFASSKSTAMLSASDADMQALPTDAAMAIDRARLAPGDAVTNALDPAEFLDVQMQQFAGTRPLIAHDR